MNQIIVFQKQFADPIKAGTKNSTLRLNRPFRQRLQIGDTVYLRTWAGKARHSKQIPIGEGEVTQIKLWWWDGSNFYEELASGFPKLDPTSNQAKQLAEVEGFANYGKMLDWFLKNHPTKKADAKAMRQIIWKLKND